MRSTTSGTTTSTGSMLMQAMLAAAERGVRVRLLIDDNNTKGMDVALALLDAHANIEVRLFNPLPIARSPGGLRVRISRA